VRASPYWAGMEALAHTLAYDAECLGDGRPPADRLARITQPTLVATGAGHPAGSPEWVRALDAAADMIAASIPRATRRVLAGQGHVVEPESFAPVLAGFFAG
jgi:pimeloyl-ACP methyl ester carboxylesterase